MLVWYYERDSFLVDLKSSCFLELTLWYPILSSRVNLAIFRHYVLLKKDNNSIFFFCFVLFLFISICLFVIFPLPGKKEKRKRWSGRVLYSLEIMCYYYFIPTKIDFTLQIIYISILYVDLLLSFSPPPEAEAETLERGTQTQQQTWDEVKRNRNGIIWAVRLNSHGFTEWPFF